MTMVLPNYSLIFSVAWLVSLSRVADSLKITGLVVPNRVQTGDRARFSCYFSLEGNPLHSLTWTKDDLPFFRYRYGDALEDETTNSSSAVNTQTNADLTEPELHKITYEVPGITVNVQGSTLNEVSLSRVDLRASGTIGCRVRAQQSNSSDERRSNITVFDAPKSGPQIQGLSPGTEGNETLHLNCTSSPAHPPVALGWAINGQEAPTNYVNIYPGVIDGEGRTASVIGMSFSLTKDDFLGDGVLRIRCSATFMGDPAMVSEVILLKEEVRKTLPLWHDDQEQENGATRLDAGGPGLLLRAVLLLAAALYSRQHPGLRDHTPAISGRRKCPSQQTSY